MRDVLTFNERTVREAVLNAVSHRNYQMSGSIFIRQYEERLVIENPGGLPQGVTPDNILDKQVPRNRLIAEIFALSGLVERAGQGMDLIYVLSVKEGKPLPDFMGSDDYSVRLTLGGKISDPQWLIFMDGMDDKKIAGLTALDMLALKALFYKRKMALPLEASLFRLVQMGLVERKGGAYVLPGAIDDSVSTAAAPPQPALHSREKDKELLLAYIKSSGGEGAPFRELRQVVPTLSRKQVQLLLAALKEGGKIRMDGERKWARWYITGV
jgi:ATP-dependent DNA helicase RecG